MPGDHSADDLIDFLTHAGERGLMPAATAQALAVATRNVFSVLDESERAALPLEDMDGVIRRFNNKRARDFNPTSLKEYGRRVRRAVEIYLGWKNDPANFSVKTRVTSSGRTDRPHGRQGESSSVREPTDNVQWSSMASASGYQTAFPVRPGHVVAISNIPHDLSAAEAERLASFIRLLAPG